MARMRLFVALAALLFAACAATETPLQGVPRRLVLSGGEAPPEDLHADSDPEVVVLLLIRGDNSAVAVESTVEQLQEAMQARGFDRGRHLPLGCVGAYQFRFFGKPCDVLGTTQISVLCAASQVLFEAAIPFEWNLSQGFYLSVPSAFARDARTRLRADARIPDSHWLIGED